MKEYDDEMGDDDYLDEDLLDDFEPRTTESGDLLDDSNPFGYDDIDDEDDYDRDDEDED